MKWLSRLVTVALLGGLAVGAVLLIQARVAQQQVGGGFITWGQFRDASRLPVGSRVMIAGVRVGEISGLAIDGRLARVTLRLRDDVELWDDAWAEKKVASAFGDGYVEVHPGGAGPGRRRLQTGEPLGHVFEGASIDRVLRELDQALPRGQSAARRAQAMLIEARRVVGGRVALQLAAMDAALRDGTLERPIHDARDAMTRFEAFTIDAADATSGFAASLDRGLTNLDEDTAAAAATIKDGQVMVADGMASARARIDEVDPYIAAAGEAIEDLAGAGQPGEDRGRLATLIHDPELGDQIADTVEGARDFVHNLGRLNTTLGLRAEINVGSGQPRFYVRAEVSGRNDSFYLIEAMKAGQGMRPDVALTEQQTSPSFLRTSAIFEGLRITLQWGKRNDWGQVRFGLKESTWGVGADTFLFRQRLRLSTDLFGPSFSHAPVFKLAAALEVFQWIYLVGGIDDALRTPGSLQISPWPADQDAPTQFQKLRYGRDAFLGFELRFDDYDINTLLALYGAALIGAL